MYKFVVLLLIFISCNALALQVKHIEDNGSAVAVASANELTRIFVDDDRIQSVTGLTGAYTYKNDNTQGEIYIKPSEDQVDRFFNIFITTEKGRNFTLMLVPKSVPSDSIMIKLKGAAKKEALKWENSDAYQQILSNLIISMISGKNPDGYDVLVVSKSKKQHLGDIATLQLCTTYIGNHLRGEIYKLTNTQSRQITITEEEFYTPDTKAVSLQDETIAAHGTTIVYKVVSND